MIKELDAVVLAVDSPEHGLQKGDMGTVVHIFPEKKAYIVEFMTVTGRTIAVVTLEADQVRAPKPNEVKHARAIA